MPIHLIHGDDPFQVEQGLERLLKGRDLEEDIDLFRVRLSKDTLPDFINDLRQPPFFKPTKTFIVTEPEALALADNAGLMDALKIELEILPDYITLIFVKKEGLLDKRTRLYKTLKQYAKIEEVRRVFYDPESGGGRLMGFIRNQSGELGLRIEQDAAERLAFLVGSDLGRIKLELMKLRDLAGNGPITEELVDEAVVPSYDASAFNFFDALAAGKAARAKHFLDDLIEKGQGAVYLILMARRELKNIRGYLALKGENLQPEQIRSELGLSPYEFKKLPMKARRFNTARLDRLTEKLLWADQAVKTGRLGDKPDWVMDILLAEMA